MASAMMLSATVAPSAVFVGSSRFSSVNQLRAAGLPQLSLRRQSPNGRFIVRAAENTPLPDSKVDVKEKPDEPLRVFDDTPAGKFARPESERRPESGNTDPTSVMKFDGPAPETINGRLAMIGMLWAFVAEVLTGKAILDQTLQGAFVYFALVTPLFIWASLVPIFGFNESPDSRSFGPFNAQAERWNGRAAMIGFFCTLVAENLILKGPLFGFLYKG